MTAPINIKITNSKALEFKRLKTLEKEKNWSGRLVKVMRDEDEKIHKLDRIRDRRDFK